MSLQGPYVQTLLPGNITLKVYSKPAVEGEGSACKPKENPIRKKQKYGREESPFFKDHQVFIEKFVLLTQFLAREDNPSKEMQELWEEGMHAAKLMRSKYYKGQWVKKFDQFWAFDGVEL